MNPINLDRLFNPRGIALIGASAQPNKWGNVILLNILKGAYKGKVYPVNPKTDLIFGYKCYKNVTEIPNPVDVALVTTPAHLVISIVDDCAKKAVPFLVVITSNFSEAGALGAQMEAELVAKAKRYGIHIVGPNTMGIFSAKTNLHALMPTVMPLLGSVSMFSQSGNVGVQMLDYGEKENVGFEKFVSSGNEGDLNCVDYLQYFAHDNDTKVILGYIEGVGSQNDFLPISREVSKKKPIIILKGGRTRVGTKAAASHSGSLAGAIDINRAVFKQAGIVEVQTSLELIDSAKAFANYPLPKGNHIGIITRGGGWGVITADSCEEAGLRIPPLSMDLIKKIDEMLPEYWNRGNPIDLVATISSDPFPEILRLMAEWDGVDAIIALGAGFKSFSYEYSTDIEGPPELLTVIHKIDEALRKNANHPDRMLELIGNLVRKTGKPIISVSTGSDYSHRHYMEEYGIVSFPTPERAVRVLRNMLEYSQFQDRSGGIKR